MNFIKRKLDIFKINFKKFWKNASKSNLPQELVDITDNFILSDSFKYISNYWHSININIYTQFINKGININTKNIDGQHYNIFANLISDLHTYSSNDLIKNTFKNVENNKINYEIDLFKKHDLLDYDQSYKYNQLVTLLYANLRKLEEFKLLKSLNNNTFIDPYIEIENTKVTLDKILTLFKYNSISSIPSFSKQNNIILEVGAGQGGVAEVILSNNEKFKYIICDIPPSIFVSYLRLQKAFPNKKISLCFDVNSKTEMMSKLLKNDILFIFPHQIGLFEKKVFDIFMGIGCFHEMDKKTIKRYMNYVDIFSNCLYFDAWQITKVPFSLKKNKLSAYSESDYSINKNWKKIFIRDSIYPSNFVELCYEVKN
jgi:putative sugar O-methyltransferase